MEKNEYTALLQKARAALPQDLGSRERWSLPPAEVMKEGRFTVLRNFREIVNAVRRDETHLGKFLLQQLATAGNIDGDRLIMTGRVGDQQIMARLDDYVATYVQCIECGSPDTQLGKDGRISVLRCDACGAHQPVQARKGQRRADSGRKVGEGSTLEITIAKTGAKGQGMTEVEGYTVVVPNTKEGTKLKVKILRITGKIALAEPAE